MLRRRANAISSPLIPERERLIALRALGVRLDDEVKVIALDRVVNDAEVVLVAAPPLVAKHVREQPLDALLPERGQPGLRA